MPKSLIPRCLLAGMFFATLMMAVVASPPKVTPVKLGHAGIRPQAVMDDTGIVHIVQASAEVRGELNYVRHVPGEGGFSEPIEVLQTAEDMAASFNMAVGKDGRVHVITRPNPMYSKKILGAEAFDTMFKSKARFFVLRYMLHSRLNDAGDAFEEEANLVGDTIGFEGVGAIVADPKSAQVYAFWPGQLEPGPEMERDMYMAVSKDEGKTWSNPKKLDIDIQGNCRCCPIQATMDADRNLFLVYRNSVKTSPSSWDKDTFLMVSRDAGETWSKRLIEKWENCGCPGAPYSMATSDDGVFFGYSTRGTSSFARVADNLKPVSVPDSGKPATRPNVATNGKGQVLLAWTEAQDVLWQVYDKGGQPIEGCLGRLEKVAARWSNPAVVATQAGDFLLYYDSQNTINKPGA